ncbi:MULTISPECIES: WGR domain-containing protein [Nostoc]|uniref:WGR domain-containing protein n=1 Tax=Nostoc paludosum FACHB-159 TaxID=2692908 RepID=A0ABR8K860_9NOSO|nr:MULTISPECIES: WGR domain-containing protein [Nostoc]MBD2676827.1 WGR domain-containing protein [Nostoc sp. FACHB-857]MBD2735014.1 WGR domain-containing protein [Nostoc paludosum FACHB-159]
MVKETTYLEFSDTKSHKFYEVTISDVEVTVRYGRIGDKGKTTVTLYDTAKEAEAEVTKLVNSKLKKGYERAEMGNRVKQPISRGDRRIAGLNHLRRTSWQPIIKPTIDTPLASKYLGKPWFSPGATHPICYDCGKPLKYHFQLNLQELPESLEGKFGTGLFQLFTCWDCFKHFPQIVKLDELSQPTPSQPEISTDDAANLSKWAADVIKTNGFDEFNGRYMLQIMGWQPFDDYPFPEDAEETYGTEYSEYEDLLVFHVTQEDFDYYDEDDPDRPTQTDIQLAWNRKADKLSGWGYWGQHVEYKYCHICAQPMQFFYQLGMGIEYEGNRGLEYSVDDVVLLFQCAEHKDEFNVHDSAF